VLPFFDQREIPLNRVLTDRGTEYCGAPERHEYELYLAVENIDHTRTKTRHPQTNGICERFHKTMLNEFYGWRSGRRSIGRWTSCRPTWITGCRSTMSSDPTRDAGATAKRRADVCGQCALGEGENVSSLNPVRTRCLSDEVLSYTPKIGRGLQGSR
jgi:hypothetical protein